MLSPLIQSAICLLKMGEEPQESSRESPSECWSPQTSWGPLSCFLVRSCLKDCSFCQCNSVLAGGAHSSCWLYNVLCPGSWWPHYSPAFLGVVPPKRKAKLWVGSVKEWTEFLYNCQPQLWTGQTMAWSLMRFPPVALQLKGLGSRYFLSAGFVLSIVSVPCLSVISLNLHVCSLRWRSAVLFYRGNWGLKT